MAYLRNRSSLMSMQEIALQHILLQLWSVGYIFVDAVAIASQTLIAELVSKKEQYQKSTLQKELVLVTTVISFILGIMTVIFLNNFVEIFGGDNFDLYIDFQLRLLVAISLFIGCYAFLWDGVLLGLDRPKEFSFITVASSVAGFLVCAYLLRSQNTISTLWIGLNVSLMFRSLLGYVYQK